MGQDLLCNTRVFSVPEASPRSSTLSESGRIRCETDKCISIYAVWHSLVISEAPDSARVDDRCELAKKKNRRARDFTRLTYNCLANSAVVSRGLRFHDGEHFTVPRGQ